MNKKSLNAEIEKSKEDSLSDSNNYYKKLYQNHLAQCSTLAEQLICLRSDMDKSNAIIMKKHGGIDSVPGSEKKSRLSCTSKSSFAEGRIYNDQSSKLIAYKAGHTNNQL